MIKYKKAFLLFLGFFLTVSCCHSLNKVKAFTDTKEGSVETKESFMVPELFKKSEGQYFNWSIERTSKYYGWTPAQVGGSATVDSNGNLVSLNTDTYPYYHLTGNGLEGSWAVGDGIGDFGHILSYQELNDICKTGKTFHDVADHRDWPDEGSHVMICSAFEKFKTIDCGFECDHKDNYKYAFSYDVEKNNSWVSLDQNNVNKCERIKVTFLPEAEWFADLNHFCEANEKQVTMIERRTINLLSPPTGFAPCADKDTCLNQAQEYELKPGTYGKGLQQVPADFIENTQNSLNSDNDKTIVCTNGTCIPYASGQRSINAVAPANNYFGQCRAEATSENVSGENVNLPLVKISPPPAAIAPTRSVASLNIINRPPVATVSLEKNNAAPGESVKATCDIVDPDECSDKIVKVKWSCFNDQGQQVNCYFLDKDGIWQQGSTTEDIADKDATNPYQSVTTFKGTTKGNYVVECEGSDDDLNSPATSSSGVGGIIVNDGTIAAGSCVVTRVKPSLDIDSVNVSDKVIYQANVIGGDDPVGYNWSCDKNASSSQEHHPVNQRSDQQTCQYQQAGSYEPKTSYEYKDKDGNVHTGDCINAQSTGVKALAANTNTNNAGEKGVKACVVEVSKTSSNYLSQLTIDAGDSINARIRVTDGLVTNLNGKVTWKFGNVVDSRKTQKISNIIIKDAGLVNVEASVTNDDGSVISCSQASVNVNEKVKWGLP